jgi:hypothetical protein
MCDVLRIPVEPQCRWMDLILLHEVVADMRAEISLVRNALSQSSQCSEQQGQAPPELSLKEFADSAFVVVPSRSDVAWWFSTLPVRFCVRAVSQTM